MGEPESPDALLRPPAASSLKLAIREPGMHDPPRTPLLSFKDTLIIRLEMDHELLKWLHRIVELEREKVLGIGQLLDQEWEDFGAERNQGIIFFPDRPGMWVRV